MGKILLGYAMSFISFLIQNMDDKDIAKIRSIVLFGSVARGSATPKSDIDLFVDIVGTGIKTQVEKTMDKFYESEMYKKYWKLLGISNPINVIADSLKNWPSLKESIWANGITLYGKYETRISKKENVVIFAWSKVKPESRRVYMSKKLYGWKYRKKRYPGLVENTNAIRLGPNALIVPIENSKFYVELFRKFRVAFRSFYASRIG